MEEDSIINKKRKELLLLEIAETKAVFEHNCEESLKQVNSMLNKCYLRSEQSNYKTAYRILKVRHKLVSQGGKQLLEIIMDMDKNIKIHVSQGKFGKQSVVYNFFQNTKYGEMEYQRFKIEYDKNTNKIDIPRSISNYMMFTKEIPTEMYEELCTIAEKNTIEAKKFISKYKL